MMLGLGVSGPQVVEGWHGVAVRQAAGAHARVRRDPARDLGAREAARAPGHALPDSRIAGPDATGLGKPLKSIVHGRQIPIYLAAIGPKSVDAGRRDRRRLAADLLLALPRAQGLPAVARRGLPQGRRRQGPRRLRHRRRRRRSSSTTTCKAALDASSSRSSRSTSAAWARAARTSTTTSPAATASRRRRRRSRTSTSPARRTRRWPRCPTSWPTRCRWWARRSASATASQALEGVAGRHAQLRHEPGRDAALPGRDATLRQQPSLYSERRSFR